MDPISRPVPHVSSAEQCSGQATYVDDMPRSGENIMLSQYNERLTEKKT